METELALTLPNIEKHLDRVASRVWFPPACSLQRREKDEKTMESNQLAVRFGQHRDVGSYLEYARGWVGTATLMQLQRREEISDFTYFCVRPSVNILS